MAKSRKTKERPENLVSPANITHILGNLDDATLAQILALQPTIHDIEEASLWLGGDRDVFGAGQPLSGIAGDVVAIVTASEEEEESPRAR